MDFANDIASLKQIRGLVIDMDGVLWQGDRPLPGIHEFFNTLRQQNIQFILATNNNTMPPEGFVKKAASMGVELTLDNIMTASLATISYLQTHYPAGTAVYVIGETPLKKMVTDAGFVLAEKDLEMRGPGDFFGVRQSGMPELRVANLGDAATLEAARSAAQALFARDPLLEQEEHAMLAEAVSRFWSSANLT